MYKRRDLFYVFKFLDKNYICFCLVLMAKYKWIVIGFFFKRLLQYKK